MPKYVNVNGVWKQEASGHVNVSGVWKTKAAEYVNVNGVWKQDSAYPMFTFDNSYQSVSDKLTNVSYGFQSDGFYMSARTTSTSGYGAYFRSFYCNVGNGIVLKKGDVVKAKISVTCSNLQDGMGYAGVYLEYSNNITYKLLLHQGGAVSNKELSITVDSDFTTTYPFKFFKPTIQFANNWNTSYAEMKIVVHSVTVNGTNILPSS